MCGISGVYSFKKQALEETGCVEKATARMFHRGPDAGGIYRSPKLILSQRRLSIIDTSHGADQPMYDWSGRFTLVFNGEIFNYRDLRKEKLQDFDIPFQTNSDTEVLLYLLIHYGTECLNWLRGFFAIAFYDIEQDSLLLVRDRYGEKPLLYCQSEDQLFFASEMKSMMEFPVPKQINTAAVRMFFHFLYMPSNVSVFQHIHKLQPGHYISIRDNKVEEAAFYTLKIRPEEYPHHSYHDAQERLRALLMHSVEKRMISDVPLGAFLSGGIDSSVVVALASAYTDRLKTFTIGYTDNALFDETRYAKLVADKYNTEHNEVKLSSKDFMEEVFNVLQALDEPFADSSAIPQYILCKYTRQFVTVALSGDGADEVFAGYNKHHAEWMLRNNAFVRTSARLAKPLLNFIPQNKNTVIGNYTRQMAKLSKGAGMSDRERYINWCSVYGGEYTSNLFTNAFLSTELAGYYDEHVQRYSSIIKSSDFNEVLLADVNLVLAGDMLHKVDMMSMANSLEVRSPFLDHDVINFAFSLPSSYKIDKNFKKKILQDSFRDLLPTELYNRPKQGFEIPLLDWFRNEFNSYIFDELLNRSFIEEQNIFNYSEIQELKRKLHSNNPGFVQAVIWGLIVFQNWYKKYIQHKDPSTSISAYQTL